MKAMRVTFELTEAEVKALKMEYSIDEIPTYLVTAYGTVIHTEVVELDEEGGE